ncbi:carboxypeptidase-like regulatory domain-containing protein [Pseudarcicella hirudinis]|uniref:TonB-dependent receptor n=1 Tax=Pseudarcicella hirudinis TaxID=1079859 RepID=UPI0035EEF258
MNFKLLRSLMMSLGILLAGQLNAQTNKGSIKGIVKDANNQTVPYAVVQLKGRSIGTTADGNGSFKFTGIPAGEQIVKASFVGYSFQEKTVIVRANETVTVDFILEESNSQLNEVIVSASRRTESLAETPSSVTVIGSKEIEAQSAISPNIANIIAYAVPGLGASTNQTGNFGQTLRGRNVLVLIDGIPQSTPLRAGSRDIRTIDPTVIERVEVIKGATAIYGNGADGGLINYITKHPNQGLLSEDILRLALQEILKVTVQLVTDSHSRYLAAVVNWIMW